jgi:ATP-dependent NAD(P)H-hydrate dehydratase
MSQFFYNCVVVRKGIFDIVTDGKESIYINNAGSKKRCGGIGDILAGCIGTLCQYTTRLDTEEVPQNKLLMSAAAACMLVRQASFKAFTQRGHSLVSPDILNALPDLISEI